MSILYSLIIFKKCHLNFMQLFVYFVSILAYKQTNKLHFKMIVGYKRHISVVFFFFLTHLHVEMCSNTQHCVVTRVWLCLQFRWCLWSSLLHVDDTQTRPHQISCTTPETIHDQTFTTYHPLPFVYFSFCTHLINFLYFYNLVLGWSTDFWKIYNNINLYTV